MRICLLFVAFVVAASAQCDYTATTSTYSSVLGSAASGSTICLAPGTYSWVNSSKSSMTTIQPNAGAGGTQSNVLFSSANITSSSQNLNINNVTMNGATVGGSSTPALHIHLTNIAFTDSVCVNNPTNVNQDTLIDSSTFINIGQSCTEGRLGITGNNHSHSVVNGVVITNNLFQGTTGGGASDGIQFNGQAYGTIIRGNTFKDILEGTCGAVHCDAIQFYGADHTTIDGNFFYNVSTGIMAPDCNAGLLTVTNNVFVKESGSAANAVMIAGGDGDLFEHNTFDPNSDIRFGNPNGCGLSTNETVTNNILSGGISFTEGQNPSQILQSYNIYDSGGSCTGCLNGSPTYVGGSSPSTYAGFALTTGSLGHNAASDGDDIGIVLDDPPPATSSVGVAGAVSISGSVSF